MLKELWVYKCNTNSPQQGDWNYFFSGYKGGWGSKGDFGGRSRRMFLEEITPGDLVLAYQTDDEAAIGLCRVERFSSQGGQREKVFLKPLKRFRNPIKLHELKKKSPALARVRALRNGSAQGALHATTPEEALELLDACGVRTDTAGHIRTTARRRRRKG